MGKKGGSGINLKAALKVVNQLGKQMSAESTGDYNVALSALTAGQKNLSKQTRAFTRDMLLSQGQNQQALGALGARARAQSGVVSAKQAAATSRYGSALGASVASQYKPAAAVAAGTGRVVTGQAKQGKGIGRVGETVAGIAQAGVVAQQAAAEYGLAQALQQRNIVDAQTLASLTGDLYKTAMSYNMQWDMWKKQQQYAAKQAEKAQGGQMAAVANALTEESPQIGLQTWQAYDDAYQAADGDTSQINIKDIATAWADENGYDPASSPEVAVFVKALQQMKATGANPQDIDTTSVMAKSVQSLYGALPGWDKYGSAITDSITAGTHAEFSAYYGPGGGGYTQPDTATSATSGTGADANATATSAMRAKVSSWRSQGMSDGEIASRLLSVGWTQEQINQALGM